MRREISLPDPARVQRDAMQSSVQDAPLGSNLEAMLARISAEVTHDAQQRRAVCSECRKPHLAGCTSRTLHNTTCPNLLAAEEKALDKHR